ncbi:Calx-beta domain-containing protein, partial [uncultured Algibacter sp.]|uniref:Ig-like domain-containing protein n=1 Tax=uncultured Algibacter sp. TaxID=298659 RepID=UPI0026165B08
MLANGVADEQIGAKYIYQDIEFSADGILIDAIVTIIDKVNMDEPDAAAFTIDSTLGVDDRFEPTVNTGAGDGYVEWQVEFVLDGTVIDANDVGVRARLETFSVEAIDVDGFEYFEVIVTDSYTIEGGSSPATELVVSQNGPWTRFQSGSPFAPGISAANTEYVVRVDYTNISTINFRNGSSNDSNNRQNSISFLGEVTFDIENTVVVNEPPVVVDNLGNTISANSLFSTNVLTGSSDPDGNLDPTTVRLIDPSNAANQGSVGNPLVISGVGTYTVDNNGNVTFVPETDYIGDASILFSVEDDLGVSSNHGDLQITIVDPCAGGTSGTLIWETAPTNNSEFDWTPDGALSNTFNDISGSGLNATISFTGDTGTLGGWNFGAGDTPEVATDNGVEALQFFTTGFNATGITITIAFSQPVNEVEFNLAHVNGSGPNGDSYTITASEVGGGTLFPLFTPSANPSYTTNTSGFVDSNNNSTFADNDEVGVNFSSSNGINFITLVWDECTACNPGTVHGSAIQDISFCYTPSPTVSIGDVTVTEGVDAVVPVSIDVASAVDTVVDIVTTTGTAGTSDYTVTTTTVTIPAGSTSVNVTVPTTDDGTDEPDETFTVDGTVTSGNTSNTDPSGTVTITDNDATPTVTIGDVTVGEGDGTATVPVTLSAPSAVDTVIDIVTTTGT